MDGEISEIALATDAVLADGSAAQEAEQTLMSRAKGAEQILAHAVEHPRATLSEFEVAAHVSHSTLQRRLRKLDEAGIMRNVGTTRQSLWEVAGTRHDPSDPLTQTERRVLQAVRQDPPPQTSRRPHRRARNVPETGVSRSYHELAYLGFLKKSGRTWFPTTPTEPE